MKTCLALVLGMLLFTLAPARAAEDAAAQVEAKVKRARELYSKGDYRDGCRAYQEAHELAQGKSVGALLGLSECFAKVSDQDKAIVAARQAITAAKTSEERTAANRVLANHLLHRPDEASRTEAASLFKELVAGPDGSRQTGRLITALLLLHRDQEAAEILASLRKQGKSEEDLQREVFFDLAYPMTTKGVSAVDERGIAAFNESLMRLDPNAPLRVGGKVTRPEIVHQTKPEMPSRAQLAVVTAPRTVIVETLVDVQGRVASVKVLKDEPDGLTEAAVDAVKQWTFKPATLDGKPVPVWYVLTVNFQIR